MKSKFESFEMKTVSRAEIHGAPYNPRKIGTMQKKRLRDGIKKHGLVQPIIVNERTMNIVGGHQRLSQLDKLEGNGDYSLTVAIIDVDESEEAQINIELNNTSMQGEWDFSKLAAMPEAFSFDFQEVGFTVPDVNEIFDNLGVEPPKPKEHKFYGDERLRTDRAYNLHLLSVFDCDGEFPTLRKVDVKPDKLIGFNYALSTYEEDKHGNGCHFFIDDYQFERMWNDPLKYVDALGGFDCVLSPDFSLYLNMPLPMKRWNVFRSRAVGWILSRHGVTVVLTLSWAEKETFSFCFDGIQEGSTVAVSTIGVKRDRAALKIWSDGMAKAIERLSPSRVLLYGGDVGFDFGNCDVRHYKNSVTERMSDGR